MSTVFLSKSAIVSLLGVFGFGPFQSNPTILLCDLPSGSLLNQGLSRREWLRLFFGAGLLSLSFPLKIGEGKAPPAKAGLVEQFLGEELRYRIGFWLFPNCGEARTRFMRTERTGVYCGGLEGRTLGFIDFLLGHYRYAYVSYFELSAKEARLRPIRFELKKNRAGKVSRRSVTFDYERKQITYAREDHSGETRLETARMEEGVFYEDYLTLFYNFRYGCYGPLKRGCTYHLPIHIHRGMEAIDLSIASRQEEEKHRQRELDKRGKDFFLRFRVRSEDVSSTTGEIEGWLSSEGVPVKGTIKDVILFGDLSGELVERRIERAGAWPSPPL